MPAINPSSSPKSQPAQPAQSTTGLDDIELPGIPKEILSGVYGHIGTLSGQLISGEQGTAAVGHTGSSNSSTKTTENLENAWQSHIDKAFDEEIKIASGASIRGSTDLGAFLMYMRYVEAIKKTVQKISDPAARKIASEKEKAINEMATIFHKNQQIKTPEEQKNLTKYVFNKLSTNGKVLIPSFSTNHAMLM